MVSVVRIHQCARVSLTGTEVLGEQAAPAVGDLASAACSLGADLSVVLFDGLRDATSIHVMRGRRLSSRSCVRSERIPGL